MTHTYFNYRFKIKDILPLYWSKQWALGMGPLRENLSSFVAVFDNMRTPTNYSLMKEFELR